MKKLVLSLTLFIPFLAFGQQEMGTGAANERASNYRTREERREAGLGTELTDWLVFSGLVEAESIREVTKFDVELSDHYDFSTDPSVQAAFDVSILDILEVD